MPTPFFKCPDVSALYTSAAIFDGSVLNPTKLEKQPWLVEQL